MIKEKLNCHEYVICNIVGLLVFRYQLSLKKNGSLSGIKILVYELLLKNLLSKQIPFTIFCFLRLVERAFTSITIMINHMIATIFLLGREFISLFISIICSWVIIIICASFCKSSFQSSLRISCRFSRFISNLLPKPACMHYNLEIKNIPSIFLGVIIYTPNSIYLIHQKSK